MSRLIRRCYEIARGPRAAESDRRRARRLRDVLTERGSEVCCQNSAGSFAGTRIRPSTTCPWAIRPTLPGTVDSLFLGRVIAIPPGYPALIPLGTSGSAPPSDVLMRGPGDILVARQAPIENRRVATAIRTNALSATALDPFKVATARTARPCTPVPFASGSHASRQDPTAGIPGRLNT